MRARFLIFGRAGICAVMLASMLAVSGCSGKNPHFDPDKAHHTPTGFRNNYPHSHPSRLDLLRWSIQRRLAGVPRAPRRKIATVRADLDFIQANAHETAVTWIGHATVLVQMGGLNILTDPHFSERASPVQWAGPRRHQPPGLHLDDLPRIDVVLISHSHYDHLDLESVRSLAARDPAPLFLVPLGAREWFQRNVPMSAGGEGQAARVLALDWWDEYDLERTRFHFVPVQHWSQRTLLDRNRALWGGWAVLQPGFRFFFSGDMGYSRDARDIGERFGGFDLAAIPVGAYEPRWFMRNQHVNPEEAVQVHKDILARQSLGIHWGTFELTDEPLDQPIEDLAAALKKHGLSDKDVFFLRHGETRKF
jgi:L-ascorbate metabolism protein UlaG (beta-lactamase superfamily)